MLFYNMAHFIDKTCRTCLINDDMNMKVLFINSAISDLLNALIDCTSLEIKLNDGLPQQVCNICAEQINAFYLFKQRCVEADKSLKNCYENADSNRTECVKNNNTSSSIAPFLPEVKNQNFKVDSEKSYKYLNVACASNKAPTSSVNGLIQVEEENSFLKRNRNECKVCGKVYKTTGHLKLHEKIHVDTDCEEHNKCVTCAKRFNQRGALKNHMKIHSGASASSEKAARNCFECRLCHMRLSTQSEYNVHMKSEHSDLERRTCHFCKQILSCRISLMKHLKRHNDEIRVDNRRDNNSVDGYECIKCDRKFISMPDFQQHLVADCDETAGKPTAKCNKCNKIFLNDKHLQKHCANEHKSNSYQCGYCSKRFRLRCNLKLHSRIHTGHRPFGCETCRKRFHYSSGLRSHVRNTHHQLLSLTFKCELCSKIFKSKDYLRAHSRREHCRRNGNGANGDGNFAPACRYCRSAFANSTQLREHLKLNHLTQLCSICGFLTHSSKLLRAHLQKHDKRSLFDCDRCEKRFRSKTTLKYHCSKVHDVNVGTEERNYTCKLCNKKYARKSGLRRHHLSVHEGIKVCTSAENVENSTPANSMTSSTTTTTTIMMMVFDCRECNKKFRTANDLMNHVSMHQGKFAWTCEICNHGFNRLGNYKTHMRRHTGIKPFVCDVCGISFFDSSGLKIHKRIHSGEKPYPCDFCDGKFSTSGGLRRHKLRLHST